MGLLPFQRRYWSRNSFFSILLYLTALPSEFSNTVSAQNSRTMGLPGSENMITCIACVWLYVLTYNQRLTDRQTDRQRNLISVSHGRMLTRDKKNCKFTPHLGSGHLSGIWGLDKKSVGVKHPPSRTIQAPSRRLKRNKSMTMWMQQQTRKLRVRCDIQDGPKSDTRFLIQVRSTTDE